MQKLKKLLKVDIIQFMNVIKYQVMNYGIHLNIRIKKVLLICLMISQWILIECKIFINIIPMM